MAGRPKKEAFETEDDRLAYVFAQLFSLKFDENGEMKYVRNGNRLTLEDEAFLEWIQDGKPGKGPITKVGQAKREQKLLNKIKFKLLKSGYSLEDLHELIVMLSKSGRESAKCCDKIELIDY